MVSEPCAASRPAAPLRCLPAALTRRRCCLLAEAAAPKKRKKEKKRSKEEKKRRKEEKAAKKAAKAAAAAEAAAAAKPKAAATPESSKRAAPEQPDSAPPAKRQRPPEQAQGAAAGGGAEAEVKPMSEKKATKKLTKKLGRAPTEAEISAFIAKKLKKKQKKKKRAEHAAAAAAPAGERKEAKGGEQGKAAWIDSVGDPPRKGQVPDGKGGWHWPPRPPPTGNVTILLFYGYVSPEWSRAEHDAAITFAKSTLERHKCTGRLRVAREGFNGTLTGPHHGIRAFTKALREWCPQHFGHMKDDTEFKYVDKQPDSQMLKELKVFPVSELVTYGFPKGSAAVSADRVGCHPDATLLSGGNHLSPADYHKAMDHPNSVMIDVRNFNESIIGKFAPPQTTVLDPCMRRSTEFPQWVEDNMDRLKGKKVLMYCTGGIRCERASAYLVSKGLTDVNQLKGGIHRYLEEYEEDGGYWVGSNYTFDKRFSHGAKNKQVISKCVVCDEPWERYAAHKKCTWCKMEVLVCRTCDRKAKAKPPNRVPIPKDKLVCPLCRDPKLKKVNQHGVQG